MKDIKTLYFAARTGGSRQDLSMYNEAVQDLFEHHPTSFVSNLEYIISSDTNLSTLDNFVEKYGLSIPVCNSIIEILEGCIERCQSLNKDSSLFKESLDKYISFRDKNKKCFTMYEYYVDDELSDQKGYVEAYYSFNKHGIQGRRLVSGTIGKFGPMAIPDALLAANSYGSKAVSTLYEFMASSSDVDSTAKEWIVEAARDLSNHINTPAYRCIVEKSLTNLVAKKITEDNTLIRESVITGDEDTLIEYNDRDLDNIKDLISFKEYQLTLAESAEDACKLQNEIYSLYESLDGIIETSTGIGIFESAADKDAAKRVTDKLIRFGKELTKDMKTVIKDVKTEVKESDDKAGKRLFRQCTVSGAVSIGDSNKPFGVIARNSASAKNKTTKNIINEASSDSKYLNDIKYHITMEVTTGIPLTNAMEDMFRDIAHKVLVKSKLNDYVNEGYISFSTPSEIKNPDPTKSMLNGYLSEFFVMTIYHYTISWVVHISRDWAFDGVDMSVFESGNMKYLIRDIQLCLQESYMPSVIEDFEEGRFNNSDNKYTGNAPSYLSNNHDLSYGEVDDDKSIEDFKRPSAKAKDDESDKSYTVPDPQEKSTPDDAGTKEDIDRAINNYYYYTYTNSLNKNSNSFNNDNSSHGDNSVHRSTDDHSTGKRVNSNDYHESTITEDVGDADDMKPESDHPVRDAAMDLDRKMVKTQQAAKKKVQGVMQAGSAFVKPVKRTYQWTMKLVNDWKDKNETQIKEKLADPHARKNIFSAIGWCIKTGSLAKAGLLLNPVFLFLTVTKNAGKKDKSARIRREMIGELKVEMEILDEKINDAKNAGDNKAKYKLMRLKNEINKKLLRVGGADVRSYRKVL